MPNANTYSVADAVALTDYLLGTDDPAGTPLTRNFTVERVGGFILRGTCEGRLTMETGVPISTSDQSAKTTLYFTPYTGTRVCLFDGTRWKLYTFAEVSLALGTITSDKNYDVFLYDNSGTLTLELSAAWSSDTARTDALTTQDGVTVKSGATTRLHVGWIRTTTTTTTEDSESKRFVKNRYNKVKRSMRKAEATDSWTVDTTTFQYVNNSSANRVEVLTDLGDAVDLTGGANVSGNSTSGGYILGIGHDASNALATGCRAGHYSHADANATTVPTRLTHHPALGYHYYALIERSDSDVNGATLRGDTTVQSVTAQLTQIEGWVDA